MLKNIGRWFSGLTKVGKASVVSSVVLSGMFAAAMASPTPDPDPVTNVPAIQKQVVIQPVTETKIETESIAIPFESRTVEDGSLAKGVEQVRTEGADGVKTVTHTITLVDGEETDRKSSEKVTTEPITRVIAVGTYIEPAPITYSETSTADGGVVKMSRSSICHAPGTTYYNRTKNYTSYGNLDACLSAGGRMPLR